MRDEKYALRNEIAHALPLEVRTRIGLPSRRNVGVPHDSFYRVAASQRCDEAGEYVILLNFEGLLIASFQLNADREIVTTFSTAPSRCAGMPCAQRARHELQYLTVASHQKVSGDAQREDFTVVGVLFWIERVGEELFNAATAELARREADGVNDD